MVKSSSKENLAVSLNFFPNDWLASIDLAACSLAAQGLWMRIFCMSFVSPKRGALLLSSGVKIDSEILTRLIQGGYKKNVIDELLNELENNGVFSRLEDGTIINRRLYFSEQRKKEISDKRKLAIGSRWGKTKKYKQNTNKDTKEIQTPDIPQEIIGDRKDNSIKAIDNKGDCQGEKEECGIICKPDNRLGALREVVEHYKQVGGFDKVEGWDRVYFSRYTKSAKQLLGLCNNSIEEAKRAISEVIGYLQGEGLSWTLETVIKQFGHWQTGKLIPNRDKRFLNNLQAGQKFLERGEKE